MYFLNRNNHGNLKHNIFQELGDYIFGSFFASCIFKHRVLPKVQQQRIFTPFAMYVSLYSSHSQTTHWFVCVYWVYVFGCVSNIVFFYAQHDVNQKNQSRDSRDFNQNQAQIGGHDDNQVNISNIQNITLPMYIMPT